MKKAERGDSNLELLVPDSGRTWSILVHQIRDIPSDEIQRGDVFIVRHATKDGVMFMQATGPTNNGHNGWMFEALKLRGTKN